MRKDYAARDHVGVKVTSVANPVAAQDAATKAYVDAHTQDRWSGTMALTTIPNETTTDIGVTAADVRGISYSGGLWTVSKSGMYLYFATGRWSAPDIPQSVRSFFAWTAVEPNVVSMNGVDFGNDVTTVTGVVACQAGYRLRLQAFQGSGASKTIVAGGNIHIMRVGAL